MEEVLEGSSEDELVQAPITTTWDTMVSNNAAVLLFGFQHTHTNLTSLHPQPMDIMRLWQTFLDNVNPLIKVIHAPTIQQQIIETSTNLEGVSKGMEALLFSIYLLAVTSIDDARCKDAFGEKRSLLLARYQFGAQQALLNAEFLRPMSLVVLQALVIYLVGLPCFTILV
jgi:Fungal specific transcription factor domain